MKKLLLMGFAVLLASCSSTAFYQIYKTKSDNAVVSGSKIVFEDANVTVSYDLWAANGNAGFVFQNKANDPLTLHLDQSFFIMNGIAYDYYQSRTVTESSSQAVARSSGMYYYGINFRRSVASSTGSSTAYSEKPTITIPANSAKVISEFRINQIYYNHCNLVSFPSRRKIQTVNFDKSDSPFVFQNNITYSINSKPTTITNSFYVSEITNIPGTEAFQKVTVDNCGKKLTVRTAKNASPENFFIEYFLGR